MYFQKALCAERECILRARKEKANVLYNMPAVVITANLARGGLLRKTGTPCRSRV